MEKDKKKADIVIRGGLICKEKLIGGGNLYSCPWEEVASFFDTEGACVIAGDLIADSLDTGDKVVVVCGALAVKGGSDGAYE